MMITSNFLARYVPSFKPVTHARLFGVSKAPKESFGFRSFGHFVATVFEAERDRSLRINHPALVKYLAAAPDAAQEGIGADGGFAVPTLYEQLIVDGVLEGSPLLNVFDPIPMETASVMVPRIDTSDRDSFAGIVGAWVDELQQLTEEKPVLTLTAMKADKYAIFAPFSNELEEDSPQTTALVEAGLINLVRRKWESAILQGDGVGKPQGVLNSPSIILQSRASSGEILWADCLAMWARNAMRGSSVWVANFSVLPQLLDLAQVIKDGATPVTGISRISEGPDGELLILKRPVILTDAAPDVGDAGDLILVAPSGYINAMRKGIVVARSRDFFFDSDTLAVRITARLAGQAIFSTVWTPRNGPTQSWAVALDA